jgi:glycosyltransferase involved in cell wall biosynthesis
MSHNQPRLSIGLPVYNGEKFIKEAIDSILAQTFEDFKLIISDNASTDNTEEICRTYVNQDQRIRYFRNEKNIGCACNFNRVFELSSGEYFKWVAYDDLHASNFLIKCIEVLDKDATVILCHSQVYLIDEQGKFLHNYDIKLKTDSPKPSERFYELLSKHLCYQCYGVIRTSALKMTPLMGSYGHADGILLLRLGLLGRFHEIPEYLFFARIHPQQSMSMFFPDYLLLTNNNPQSTSNMMPDYYLYTVWFDSSKEGKILFPHWRILWEYLRSVFYGSLNWDERICCYISLQKQLKGIEHLLIKDLVLASQICYKYFHNKESDDRQIYNNL